MFVTMPPANFAELQERVLKADITGDFTPVTSLLVLCSLSWPSDYDPISHQLGVNTEIIVDFNVRR